MKDNGGKSDLERYRKSDRETEKDQTDRQREKGRGKRRLEFNIGFTSKYNIGWS